MLIIRKNVVTIAFSILSLFSQLSYGQDKTNPQPNVIPSLREWKGTTGFFKLKKTINLVIEPTSSDKLKPFINTFLNDLKMMLPTGNFIIKEGSPKKGDIYFKINKNTTFKNKEEYTLKVEEYITIEGPEATGVFWGTRSILQILEQDQKHNEIPKGLAYDYPQFAVRGLVLDVGRKFFSINFLRDYVKFMSYYKMNDFQIHLNDNGFKQFFNDDYEQTYAAFRLENETFPNLTSKDGSYTKKEFIDLQKLAEQYGVNIIPEIDVPAHSLAFTKAVPEIGSSKYGKDHLDLDNPLTIEVIDKVFKEYLTGDDPVFRGKVVHIGTDEYAKAEAEKFRAFTDHYINYVGSFGKTVRLWGALTHAKGTTPVTVKNVEMNLWYNGYADPKAMIDSGYKVISTPDGWLYIVPKAGYYYDYLNIAKLYNEWTPNMIGNQTFDENHPQILGGSFAVWNDHVGNGITEKDVNDRVFPAMQVLAQKMWIGSTAKTILPFTSFVTASKKIGEGPGLNMRGKINGKDSLVLNYDFNAKNLNKYGAYQDVKFDHTDDVKSIYFKGGKSFIKTPVEEIGYDYTISFTVKADEKNPDDAILFSSPNAIVKLKQQATGKLGFSRENYNYNFNYELPSNTWTNIVITGNNKGTSLYVNGSLVEKLEGNMREFANTKAKTAKVQTLFFPLQYIGSESNSFIGYMDNLKVFNKILSDKEIKAMSSQ